MSRRRDWDKAERERRAFLNGILPAWVEGWAPAGVEMPIPISSGRGRNQKSLSRQMLKNVRRVADKIVDEEDFGEWTILRLDFRDVGGYCLPSFLAYSDEAGAAVSHSNFYATVIKYDCVGIPHSTREALFHKHLKGLRSGNDERSGRQQIRLINDLNKISTLRRWITRGSTLTFEFEFPRFGKAAEKFLAKLHAGTRRRVGWGVPRRPRRKPKPAIPPPELPHRTPEQNEFATWAKTKPHITQLDFLGIAAIAVTFRDGFATTVESATAAARELAADYARHMRLRYAVCHVNREGMLYTKGWFWKSSDEQ